jgi:hypothetical protein
LLPGHFHPTYAVMFRLLARFAGFWLVAAALVAAVVDGAKSIASSAFVATPFAETWATLFTSPGEGAPTTVEAPWPLELIFAWLLAAPTVAVLLVPGILFLIAGAKRRRHPLGREFAA